MPANQLNIEFFFRLLYNCLHGSCYGSLKLSGLEALLANLWLWVIIVGYALSIIALFLIVYITMRLFELRAREQKFYGTLLLAPEAAGGINPRWARIEELIEGTSPSEWREAIIEADIMLDDMLGRQGYVGDGVGDKLKSVEPSDFNTLQDAWEAHKIRNQIAHQGSTFDLTEDLARRTTARYRNVFKEFKMV